jgi:predicted Fe-Mo cluster-binding NifX family protein
MKIAISADGTDLQARVAHRFGASQYLVIVDPGTGYFEAVPNLGTLGQRGAGMHAVVLAVKEGVKAVLTGYCSPAVCSQLTANGIEILTGLSGTVGEVAEKYKKGYLQKRREDKINRRSGEAKIDRVVFIQAIRGSANQFATLLPVLLGVVLLIGLFSTFVSKDSLSSIFSGNLALDTLWGACFGSVLAGNPINSYVLGGELLMHGVSLFAITALIITWVTVGLVQLPAEIAALGRGFAFLRNAISFILSIPIAILTVVILNLVTR